MNADVNAVMDDFVAHVELVGIPGPPGPPGPAGGLPAATNAETIAGTRADVAVTPAGLAAATGEIDVRNYGAVGDLSVDDTAAIQAAIDAAAVKGGVVVVPAGQYKVSSTLVMRPNVAFRGAPQKYETFQTDQKGTWLEWYGTGTGPIMTIGTANQTVGTQGVHIQWIGFDGRQTTVTGVHLGSNTKTSPYYLTTNVHIENCQISKCGIGMTWGSGGNEQLDFIRIDQTDFQSCSIAGVRINGSNCGDASTFHTCRFVNCAPAGEPYVDLVQAGYLTFDNCHGGGDGTYTKDFIRRTVSHKLTLRACQAESMRYFFRDVSFDYQNPVEFHGCLIDAQVSIEGSSLVNSFNTKISTTVSLTGACRWNGYNDIPVENHGGRFVLGANAVHVNHRLPMDTPYGPFTEGDIITYKPTAGVLQRREEYVSRSGRFAPVWVASTSYTGWVERSWRPSTAYAVDDRITPTFGSGYKYRCSVAGTTAATEPFLHPGSVVDGTVTWVDDGPARLNPSATTYVQATVDNGHIYKLVTATGATAATEPTWPTAAGATVVDGGCTWQETGATALIRPSPVSGVGVTVVRAMTAAAYAALSPKDSTTLYVVV